MNRSGSALIFVSVLMSFVGIIAILCTRSSMLYYGFSIDRIQHVRSQFALHALTEYGIARCIKHKKGWEERFEKWPYPDGPYQGNIKISMPDKDKICHIKASLFQSKVPLCNIHCSLHLHEKEVIIEDWTYHNEE